MATPPPPPPRLPKDDPQPAAAKVISLSQLLLAPLDSIFKAQVHAARSFLSLVLQMGYPHKSDDDETGGEDTISNRDAMYSQEFVLDVKEDENGRKTITKAKIPALSLVPIAPLAVDKAEFELEFKVSEVARHSQMQQSKLDGANEENYDEHRRPWFLVKDPVSLRGVVAPKYEPGSQASSDRQSSDMTSIKIKVWVNKQPMPAALDKLLTTMTQYSTVETLEDPPANDAGTGQGGGTPPANTPPAGSLNPPATPTATPPANPPVDDDGGSDGPIWGPRDEGGVGTNNPGFETDDHFETGEGWTETGTDPDETGADPNV